MPDEESITAAQAYEDHLVGAVFGPWARRVVDLGAPKPGETVLDVACGTGIGARLVAPKVSPMGCVISTDVNDGMICVAKKSAEAANLPTDVTLNWHAVPAEQQLVDEASIDLCLYMQGPQFVTDPPAAMKEVHRALKPGGRLAASMWNEMPTNKGHYAIAEALAARDIKPAMKPFSMGDPDVARSLFANAGFNIKYFDTGEFMATFLSVRDFVNGVAAGAPATRHAIAQLSPEDHGAFINDVQNTLASFVTANGVVLPTSAHLILAHR